jgi:hypothetical protein
MAVLDGPFAPSPDPRDDLHIGHANLLLELQGVSSYAKHRRFTASRYTSLAGRFAVP